MNKDMDTLKEPVTTPMEDMVEVPAFECNTIISLPHSNNSTSGTNISAVDMIQIMKDIIVHGI